MIHEPKEKSERTKPNRVFKTHSSGPNRVNVRAKIAELGETTYRTFEEITLGSFHNGVKRIDLQIQETQLTLNIIHVVAHPATI